MADTTTKRKRGRPYAQIDRIQFENLCKLQCTEVEICDWFGGIDHKTLNCWCKRTYGKGFEAVFAEKRGVGKIALRRNLIQLGERNAAAAIFLAKNYLGMHDEQTIGVKSADETAAHMDSYFAEKRVVYKAEQEQQQSRDGGSNGDKG